MPLVDMAMPALQELSARQHEAFAENVSALIRADRRVNFFEWFLRSVIVHRLRPAYSPKPPRRFRVEWAELEVLRARSSCRGVYALSHRFHAALDGSLLDSQPGNAGTNLDLRGQRE